MEDVADDDFGELYGDLELLVTPAPEQEQDIDVVDDDDDGGDVKNKVADDDYIGSDSDDDLNIVLNDDDRRDFSVAPEEDVRGDSLGKNTECVDQLKDETEYVSSDVHGGRNRNGVKGGYGSQFFRSKYMRTQGPVFVNNVKSSKSMGLAFDSSSFTKRRGHSTQNQLSNSSYFDGRRDATSYSTQNQLPSSSYFDGRRHATNAAPYGSFLPWHWNIYDVNIDKLEEKPWRIPGADITDYFNFGFNENTWKQYCMSLGQLWQTSMQVGLPVNESAKLNQASTREQIDQAVSGSLVSPSSKCEVPKGRAIQVENSVVERQPSFNVRCLHSIDSDVVIQVKVDDSSDNNSGYVDSNVHNLSEEEEEFISGNSRNKNNSSSEHDVLFEEQLEDVKKSEESSGQKRNDLIPDIVKAQKPDEEDQHSEGAEVLEEEIKIEERVGVPDTCSADPCWNEPELSLDDQDLSLTSYTDDESEETGDSLRGDNEKNHNPLRSHLVNSDTDLKESESLHHKISKKKSFDRTPVNVSYHSRHGRPVQQGRRHHTPDSKLKRHIENDNDVSHIPKSSGRNMSRWGHQFVNYRPKERLQYFGSHKRRYVSYNSETKQSWYHGAERTVDDLVQATYSQYSDREKGDSFRENENQYIRNDGDRREYFFERRTLMEYNEDHDWHPANRKHHVVDDDLNLLSYRGESRQFHPKHSSFPAKDGETQRRRMHHQPHYKDRNCNYDQWFDECEFEFLNRSCRMPSSFAEREMEYSNDKHEEKFPQIDRALKRYPGRGRHHDSPPLVGDTPWSWKPDDDLDECPKYTHHQTSFSRYQKQPYAGSARNYVYRVNENFRGHERHGHATNRGNDWHCGYTDAAEDEDSITFPVKECEFYPHPSEAPHWTNNDNDNVVWHHDELHPEEDTFFYEETPKHERYRHSHARVRSNDIKFQQHQLNLSWRNRDRILKRSSKVLNRDHCQQAVLRCRKSVNLIDRDGKSHAKSSRVMSNDRLENVDRGIANKQTALLGFDDSRENAIKFDISKSLCDKENKNSLQNLPDEDRKEGLDIEEGEIQTEEPSLEASVYQRDVSEGAALTDTVKKRKSQNGNDSELHTGNLDSQKILDSIAKMEKRRERFKQPIGIIKEAEKSLKLNADSAIDTDKIKEGIDSAVDTDEIKQHRPARKRRWNGS